MGRKTINFESAHSSVGNGDGNGNGDGYGNGW